MTSCNATVSHYELMGKVSAILERGTIPITKNNRKSALSTMEIPIRLCKINGNLKVTKDK